MITSNGEDPQAVCRRSQPGVSIIFVARDQDQSHLFGVAQLRYASLVDLTISQRELRNDSGAIMRRVEQGESFTVTRNGTPIADLVPHSGKANGRQPRFVPVEILARESASLPSWGSRAFRDELAGFDERIDDSDVDRWNSS
jgi:prevent-host-death family protein